METEEERRTRLENDAAILKSWQLPLQKCCIRFVHIGNILHAICMDATYYLMSICICAKTKNLLRIGHMCGICTAPNIYFLHILYAKYVQNTSMQNVCILHMCIACAMCIESLCDLRICCIYVNCTHPSYTHFVLMTSSLIMQCTIMHKIYIVT